MHALQILALLLATSSALNIAFTVSIIARQAGASMAQAILTAVGAAGTVMAIFFTAIAAYRLAATSFGGAIWASKHQPPGVTARLWAAASGGYDERWPIGPTAGKGYA